MERIDSNRLGIVAAVMLSAWHAVWIVVSALGFGQPFLDFVLRMHGMTSDIVVAPFHAGMAVLLLMVAGLVGYAVGFTSGALWNCLGTVCIRGAAGGKTQMSARV